MENPSLLKTLGKLAIAGEQAEFTLQQMIELLNKGVSVETLLDLISWCLEEARTLIASPARSSGWDTAALTETIHQLRMQSMRSGSFESLRSVKN